MQQRDAYEHAFYEHAFSSHFLQDSFAAGHMGFNRAGSSAAAAQSFHDYWNGIGRDVENARNESWHTYGDNALEKDKESKKRVLEASTTAAIGLLRAFVRGVRDVDVEVTAATMIPIRIRRPQTKFVTLYQLFRMALPEGDVEMQPLTAVYRPALGSVRLEGAALGGGAVLNRGQSGAGAIVSLGLFFPFLKFPLRLYFSAGYWRRLDNGGNYYVFDFAYASPPTFSNEGLLSHEMQLGYSQQIGGDKNTRLFVYVAYRMNIEFGKTYIRLQIGPAFAVIDAQPQFAWMASIGLGHVLAAQGGGLY